MPRLENSILRVLREIHDGEPEGQPLWPRCPSRRPRACLHASEDGMLTIVSLIVILGFLLLIAFVGNVGHAVTEKVEAQNAADVAAYSSALWMARGMNAVTTTNHMMGEITAMMVLLESFGGPVLRKGDTLTTSENDDLNERIEQFYESVAPNASNFSYFLKEVDEPFVGEIAELMLDDDGKLYAGATLYDAQLTLKTVMILAVLGKNVCARVVEATWWIEIFGIGPIIEGICMGAQLGLSATIAKVGQEWITLKAIENVLGMIWIDRVRTGLADYVLPALSWYSDTLTGHLGGSGSSNPRQTVMNGAVRDALKDIRKRHEVEEVETFPTWKGLRLPVVPETPPHNEEQTDANDEEAKRLGRWGRPPSLWTGDDTHPDLENIFHVMKDIDQPLEYIRDWLGWAESITSTSSGGLGGVVGDVVGSAGSAAGIDLSWVDDLEKALNSTDQYVKVLSNLPKAPKKKGYDSNPCRDSNTKDKEHLMPEFYWEVERTSQWVRATYPYVDSFRAPIRGFLRRTCRLSNASTYYVHWTNRYTLTESYFVRREDDRNDESERKRRAQNQADSILDRLHSLRDKFELAIGGVSEESDEPASPGSLADPLREVTKELEDIAETVRRSELVGYLRDLGVPVDEWIDTAKRNVIVARQLGEAGEYEEESDLNLENFRGISNNLAQIELLDALIRLLDEWLAIVDLFLGKRTPHMYTMHSSQPSSKGYEPWVDDEVLAEELFVVLAHARRNCTRAFGSDAIFAARNISNVSCFSQAMFYNASGRDLPKARRKHSSLSSEMRDAQPNTCWDTLNWRSPVRVPEWGAPPTSSNRDQPWTVFAGRNRADRTSELQLNWQAKLVPLTKNQLTRLSKSPIGEARRRQVESLLRTKTLLDH